MEVEHFGHPDHPLILIHQLLEYSGELVICSGCDEPIQGPCYSCTSCYFFLHKKCAELPREIKRNLHRKHPLLLLPSLNMLCDFCNETCSESFVYRCFECKFNLHIECAFPPCIYAADQDQKHQFRPLLNSLSLKLIFFTCNACGTDGDDTPFGCNTCQLVVHKKCVSLPLTIKTALHHHPQIIHTYHLQDCIQSIKKYCGICQREVDTEYGVYYCPDCDFVAHVNCSREYGYPAEKIVEENEEEQSVTVNSQLMEPSFDVVLEIKDGEEKIISEIKHFSHQHNLILTDKVGDGLKCDGCMLPISTPFYRCATPTCKFFLDKTCIELPMRTTFECHGRSPMILSLNPWERDPVYCYFCGRYFHGLSYGCKIKSRAVLMDVRCFKSCKDSIDHRGHEHPLFLPAGRNKILHFIDNKMGHENFLLPADKEMIICSGCGGLFSNLRVNFKCAVCGFNLCMKCATLPYEGRHQYDDHPLVLTYNDPNDYQFVCQICEKERDPKLWFYRCQECHFDAHPKCALGKYPYVKPGGVRTNGIHPHPLALVDKTEDYPASACDHCGNPCDGLALECTNSKCNFIVHWKSVRCFRNELYL